MRIAKTMTPEFFRAGLGERIRCARMRQEMLPCDVAEAVGVSPATLSRIECGRIDVNIVRLHRIATVLGVSLGQLLKGLL